MGKVLQSVGASADELDARAFDLEAEAKRLHAEAARKRAADDCVAVTSLPLPKKQVLAACRSGALRAQKVGTRWICTRAAAAEYLRGARPEPAAVDPEDELRARLGLVTRRAS